MTARGLAEAASSSSTFTPAVLQHERHDGVVEHRPICAESAVYSLADKYSGTGRSISRAIPETGDVLPPWQEITRPG
jgi:hypothetical protein